MTTVHLCQSIEGALANWNSKHWRGVCTDKNGKSMTPAQVKKAFEAYLAEGKLVLPMGDCDNFDFQHGCRGHEEASPLVSDEA